MKIFLKTEDEIDLMRKANRLVGATLAEVGRHIKPGVSTLQLDHIAEEFIRDHGATPTFKNFPNPFGGLFLALSVLRSTMWLSMEYPVTNVFLRRVTLSL